MLYNYMGAHRTFCSSGGGKQSLKRPPIKRKHCPHGEKIHHIIKSVAHIKKGPMINRKNPPTWRKGLL